jgi:hypothetical protein
LLPVVQSFRMLGEEEEEEEEEEGRENLTFASLT